MRKTIEDLYHGNIRPNEQVIMKGSEFDAVLKSIVDGEANLNSLLEASGKGALTKMVDSYNQLLTITSREMFIQGFRIGLRLGVEAMDEDGVGIKELISTLR